VSSEIGPLCPCRPVPQPLQSILQGSPYMRHTYWQCITSSLVNEWCLFVLPLVWTVPAAPRLTIQELTMTSPSTLLSTPRIDRRPATFVHWHKSQTFGISLPWSSTYTIIMVKLRVLLEISQQRSHSSGRELFFAGTCHDFFVEIILPCHYT
jgi:hypothetical protein